MCESGVYVLAAAIHDVLGSAAYYSSRHVVGSIEDVKEDLEGYSHPPCSTLLSR